MIYSFDHISFDHGYRSAFVGIFHVGLQGRLRDLRMLYSDRGIPES